MIRLHFLKAIGRLWGTKGEFLLNFAVNLRLLLNKSLLIKYFKGIKDKSE